MYAVTANSNSDMSNGSQDTLVVGITNARLILPITIRFQTQGTEAALEMCAAAMKGEDKTRLKEIADRLVETHKAFRYDKRRVENPSGYIVDTLQGSFSGLI